MSTDKRQWHGWLYLLPILILMIIFTFYPLIYTIFISFLGNYNPLDRHIDISQFGIKWYQEIFAGKSTIDPNTGNLVAVPDNFVNSLFNTLIIVFVSVPISTIIALGMSVALMNVKKVRTFFQTIYFLPYITNTIAIGLVFSVLFNADSGLINAFIGLFGAKPINWLNSAHHGFSSPTHFHMMFVALTYIIWSGLPFKVLIFMGGLQSVNKQLYEAAQIDSTPKWRVFTKITVPQLSPLILYIVITSLIGAFKTYAAIIGLFPPGSEEAYRMQTLVGYIYDQLKLEQTYAKGAAAAVVLFIIILIMTFINMAVAKKKVHY